MIRTHTLTAMARDIGRRSAVQAVASCTISVATAAKPLDPIAAHGLISALA